MRIVQMLSSSTVLVILVALVPVATSLQPITVPRRTARIASLSATQQARTVDASVEAFEQWFANTPNAVCSPSVQYAMLGSLRGLAWQGPTPRSTTEIARVPESLVLQSDYDRDDWDVKLACRLIQECQAGSASPLVGYCQLLLQGQDWSDTPPCTAPNAIRRWNEAQRQGLQSTDRGQRLLAISDQQQATWRQQYEGLKQSDLTWNQFQWAMEVVHSRAFCGDAVSTKDTVWSLVPPIAAAGIIWSYSTTVSEPNEIILIALSVLAAFPTLLRLVQRAPSSTACLLPLIDSANHLATADSCIALDPFKKYFALQIGPKCLVREANGETQVYIRYGDKSDPELLLNYGFLPGLTFSDNTTEDEQRAQLAEAFQSGSKL